MSDSPWLQEVGSPKADGILDKFAWEASIPRVQRPRFRAQVSSEPVFVSVMNLTLDVCVVLGGTAAVYGILFLRTNLFEVTNPQIAILFLMYCPILVLALRYAEQLRLGSAHDYWSLTAKLGVSVLLACSLAFLFARLAQIHFSIETMVFLAAANVIGLAVSRSIQRTYRSRRRKNVLIVGAGKVGQALAKHLEDRIELGYRLKGFVDQNHKGSPRVLGRIESLDVIIQSEFVDEIIITIPSERELVKKITEVARRSRTDVKVLADLFDGLGWQAPVEYVGSFPSITLHQEPIPAGGLLLKRAFDVVCSIMMLMVTSPLLLVLAVMARLDSRGPSLYRSIRVGKKGKHFVCYKFRTMVSNADDLKKNVRHLNFRTGPTFKIADDPRITRIGRFLRKFSLDELPQFWNVLVGDMSVVGPRPHPLDDFAQYEVGHLRRLSVKPGITGLWQVTARQDPSFETNMALDMKYIENWSFLLDLSILVKTIPTILRGLGQ